MSLSAIRSALKDLLLTVDGIGQVHDYKRYSSDWKTYKELFKKGTKVNEWEIQREGFDVETRGSQAVEGKVKDTTHRMVLRGFYSFDDACASEKDFDTLVDSITNIFIQNQSLADTAIIVNVPIVGDIVFNFLGDVLCHMVEIRFEVKERTFL
jgi:hypothetical protein